MIIQIETVGFDPFKTREEAQEIIDESRIYWDNLTTGEQTELEDIVAEGLEYMTANLSKWLPNVIKNAESKIIKMAMIVAKSDS